MSGKFEELSLVKQFDIFHQLWEDMTEEERAEVRAASLQGALAGEDLSPGWLRSRQEAKACELPAAKKRLYIVSRTEGNEEIKLFSCEDLTYVLGFLDAVAMSPAPRDELVVRCQGSSDRYVARVQRDDGTHQGAYGIWS